MQGLRTHPSNKWDVGDTALLDELLGSVNQKLAVYTREPSKPQRLHKSADQSSLLQHRTTHTPTCGENIPGVLSTAFLSVAYGTSRKHCRVSAALEHPVAWTMAL